MSVCKTGCGATTGNYLCHYCNESWKDSPEYRRAAKQNPDICPRPSDYRALADFCNRTRAERQNGGSHGP